MASSSDGVPLVGRSPWWIPCGAAALTVFAAAWLGMPEPQDGGPATGRAAAARSSIGLVADPMPGGPGTQADGAANAQNVPVGEPQAPAPGRYTVSLASDGTGRSWTGSEQIDFGNAGAVPITEFWIRLWGNGVDGCGAAGNGAAEQMGAMTGGHVAENGEGCTAYRVVLDRPLAPGARGSVRFGLTIDVPERRDRFGSVAGQTFLGNALAVLAVKDEHGWELPPYATFGESFYSLSADFDVTLDHPTALLTPSSGQVADEHAVGDRTVTHITAPKVRDFAWSAGAFHHDSTMTSSGVEVDAYWPDSESDSNVRRLMRYAADAVDAYTSRYGAYPYPRLSLVFAEFGGAFDGMEYPTYLLTSAYAGAVAHEVAHQWWYGLVGDDQYRHPWLDEAFTEYSAEEFQGGTSPAHSCDFLAGDERMDQTMETYEAAGDYMYHDAVYHEGTCLLFDLEHTVGRGNMDKMLRGLFQKFEYGVMRPADVRAAAQAVSTTDLSSFWSRWRNTGD